MKVHEIMTTEVVSVAPETPFKDVVERLVGADVSSLPVVDPSGKLLGLITEADLISKQAYGTHRHRALALLADVLAGREHRWVAKAAGSMAADVMTQHVTVCGRHEDVRAVARRMLEAGVKRMPVVEEGVLVGMVSRSDILATLARPDEEIAAAVRQVLSDGLNMPDACHVGFTVDAGVVALSGDVRYAWDEGIIVSLVLGVPGVIDVISHLHHREPDPRPSTQSGIFGLR